jgi:hypothetical protein
MGTQQLAVKIAHAAEMMALPVDKVRALIKDGTLRTCGSGNGLRVVVESMTPWLPVHSEPEHKTLGSVYLVRSGAYYKIGLTKDIKRRMRSFITGLPDTAELVHTLTVPLDDLKLVESQLHEHFKSHRRNGEWFDLSDDDVQVFRDYIV